MLLVSLLHVVALASAALVELPAAHTAQAIEDLGVAVVAFVEFRDDGLLQEFAQAAQGFEGPAEYASFAFVEDPPSEWLKQHGISGLPAVALFDSGHVLVHKGLHTAEAITEFVRAHPETRNMTVLYDFDFADKFFNVKSQIFIGIFSTVRDPLARALNRAAGNLTHLTRTAAFLDPALAERFNITDARAGTLVWIRPTWMVSPYEPAQVIYDGPADWTSVLDFALTCWRGLVSHLQPRAEFALSPPLLVVFGDVHFLRDPSQAKYIRNRVLRVANQTTPRLKFAVADIKEFPKFQTALNMVPNKGQIHAAIFTAAGINKMGHEFSPANLQTFVAKFVREELHEKLSATPPAVNDGPVKTVVLSTFNTIVNDPSVDVVIYFHAQWCVECKDFDDVWYSLASQHADDTLRFASMDITANDVPSEYIVNAVPKLYFVPAAAKGNPSSYAGATKADHVLNWIESSRTHPTPAAKPTQSTIIATASLAGASTGSPTIIAGGQAASAGGAEESATESTAVNPTHSEL
eukprot:m.63558 g.63558  ORF g.63558 m.63558 type:complete len:522 (+) comp7201_c0_seq1:25-1590(+)